MVFRISANTPRFQGSEVQVLDNLMLRILVVVSVAVLRSFETQALGVGLSRNP